MPYPRGTFDFIESRFPPDILPEDLPKPVVVADRNNHSFFLATLVGRAVSADATLDGQPLIHFVDPAGQPAELIIPPGPDGDYAMATDADSFDMVVAFTSDPEEG
jgi:hypothetical protein